jgi:hypothetical protein
LGLIRQTVRLHSGLLRTALHLELRLRMVGLMAVDLTAVALLLRMGVLRLAPRCT